MFKKNSSQVILFLLGSFILNLAGNQAVAGEATKTISVKTAEEYLKNETGTYATLVVLTTSSHLKRGLYDCREGKLKDAFKPHPDPRYSNMAHFKQEIKDPSGNLKILADYYLEVGDNGLGTLNLQASLFPTPEAGFPIIGQYIEGLKHLNLRTSGWGAINTDGTISMDIPPKENAIDRYEVTMLINPRYNCEQWRKNFGSY